MIGEGHHRIAAAMEIARETGNIKPLMNLLNNGSWVKGYSGLTNPLPSRSTWGKLRNWLGF